MPQHTFTLTDANGDTHTYDVQAHPGGEGAPIGLQVLSMVVEPLAAAVGPVLVDSLGTVLEQVGGSTGAVEPAAIMAKLIDDPELLQALDVQALGRGARMALLSTKPELIYAILRYTNRDGKPLVAERVRASSAYDSAYARNYMELAKALWEVATYNGFFPGLSTLAGVAKQATAAVQGPAESTA